MPVVTANRIFFWIRSQTKTKSLNFSTHFRLMDFIKIILWNSPNFHSCGIFQGMACISRNKIQQLWIAVFTYCILISNIFSKILHTKSYTKYLSKVLKLPSKLSKNISLFFSSSFRSDTNWHPSFGNGYTRTVPGSRVVPTL